jgi:hypothetical protein
MADEEVRKIEITYPTVFASAAKAGGARVLAMMTVAGACTFSNHERSVRSSRHRLTKSFTTRMARPLRSTGITRSCAKTRPIGLRGLAIVELEHAAEPRTAGNRACADRRWLGRDELVAQTLVRPLLMIMLDKRS